MRLKKVMLIAVSLSVSLSQANAVADDLENAAYFDDIISIPEYEKIEYKPYLNEAKPDLNRIFEFPWRS